MEIFFSLLYATISAFFEIFKKLATNKSKANIILVLFTTTSFLCALVLIPSGIQISWPLLLLMAFKGVIIGINWYLIIKVIKSIDLSVVSLTTVISVIMVLLGGIFLFGEGLSLLQIIGSVLVVTGAVLINLVNRKSQESVKIKPLHIVYLLLSSTIVAISSIIDKYSTLYITNYQLQFWFLFFVCIFSWIFFAADCIKEKQFLIKKQDLKNFWIYLAGIALFVGDFFLFKAYYVPDSKLILITILSKFKIVVTILTGILIFKEKNIWKKLLICAMVFLGIVLISI